MDSQDRILLGSVAGFILAIILFGIFAYQAPPVRDSQLLYSPPAAAGPALPKEAAAPRASMVVPPENKSLAKAPVQEVAPEPPKIAVEAPKALQADMPAAIRPIQPIYTPASLGVTDVILPFLLAGIVAISTSFLVKRKIERSQEKE